MPDSLFFDYREMQKILGLIFIAVGITGIIVYLSRGMMITSDEKIAMILGFFMVLIGIMIIYGSRKKKSIRDQPHRPGH
jgi:uncharacterized membrane protein YfcA